MYVNNAEGPRHSAIWCTITHVNCRKG